MDPNKKQWRVFFKQREHGPFSMLEIINYTRSQFLDSSAQVFSPSQGQWLPISTLLEAAYSSKVIPEPVQIKQAMEQQAAPQMQANGGAQYDARPSYLSSHHGVPGHQSQHDVQFSASSGGFEQNTNPFKFGGVMPRLPFFLMNVLYGVVLKVIENGLVASGTGKDTVDATVGIISLLSFPMIFSWISRRIRHIRNTENSHNLFVGMIFITLLVPLLNFVMLLCLYFIPGKRDRER